MSPTFTILMPVVRPPVFLPFSVASVLAQSRADFELCIICDGAPMATIAWGQDAAARDGRIRVFIFAKGERHGEAHRDWILQTARSKYVCQIADDDLWLPNHLEEIEKLLATCDFGNALHVTIGSEGQLYYPFADFGDPANISRWKINYENNFGPTAAGYRLQTYKALPQGWSPAPLDVPSDVFMWRKFVSYPGIKLGTRFRLTSIHLLTGLRAERDHPTRVEEMRKFAQLIRSPGECEDLEQRVFQSAARASTWYRSRITN